MDTRTVSKTLSKDTMTTLGKCRTVSKTLSVYGHEDSE